MKPPLALFALLSALALRPSLAAAAAPGAGETIVLIRHGEKPRSDLGQLTCQGLNRALALPAVLTGKFGRPNFLFAPLTRVRGPAGEGYSYIRPLMTIEPTAISAELPVNTRFAYDDLAGLQRELLSPRYLHSLIFIAWEHHMAERLAKNLLRACHAEPSEIPPWKDNDFDSIYVFQLTSGAHGRSLAFSRDQEGLNGLSTECPRPAARVPSSSAPANLTSPTPSQ